MRKELGMLAALAVMCGIIATANSSFYGAANIENLTRLIAMLGIVAVGIGFVIITGGIDLSVGSIIGLSGVIIARLSAPASESGLTSGAEYPIWIGVGVALLVSLAIGLLQGWFITKQGLQPFVVTLGGMMWVRGISQTVTDGGNISFGNHSFRGLADGGIRLTESFLLTWPVLIFAVVLIVSAYLLHYTVFGRHVYALGGNRDAARYSGVPVERVELKTYVISAGLAGLAGVPYAAYIGQMSHTVGETYELLAIAAAVLGGCSLRGGEGTTLGIVIGTAIMCVIQNGINLFKIEFASGTVWRPNENWRFIIIGCVILGAAWLDEITRKISERRRKRRVE